MIQCVLKSYLRNLDYFSQVKEEYLFVKSIREKLASGEIKNENILNKYIVSEHLNKKHSLGTVLRKKDNFLKIENLIGSFLSKLKNKEILGYEDIEQYHSAATRCYEIISDQGFMMYKMKQNL